MGGACVCCRPERLAAVQVERDMGGTCVCCRPVRLAAVQVIYCPDKGVVGWMVFFISFYLNNCLWP